MRCIERNETIDSILNSFKEDLGDSFDKYRNHVYRVFNFAMQTVVEPADIQNLAIAAAFHDLGIWTHQTFDYLQPSIDLAKQYCLTNSIAPESMAVIGFMISDHHKLTRINGNELAERFRQADLVDLTFGLIRKGIDCTVIREVRKAFPNSGFHMYLCKLFIRNLFQNPLRPLPMYKW